VTIGIDRLWQTVMFEDIAEQPQVAPGTFRLGKESSGNFSAGIVDGPDQAKTRPSPLEPVMRRTIDLQHHSLGLPSLSAAPVL
jgi:hypothetical protein